MVPAQYEESTTQKAVSTARTTGVLEKFIFDNVK
jgi:hypothetical protein